MSTSAIIGLVIGLFAGIILTTIAISLDADESFKTGYMEGWEDAREHYSEKIRYFSDTDNN